MTRAARIATLLAGILVCVGCDQSSKMLAVRYLSGSAPLTWFGDTFRLHYVENQGAFLSLGAALSPGTRMVLFELMVGLLLAGLTAYALLAKRLATAEVVATALIVGGGVGNLIDRLHLGYVRDFANLGLGRLRTGVFNVADLAIMAGFAVLIVYLARTRSTGAPREG